MRQILVFSFFMFFHIAVFAQAKECFLFMAGKDATKDGKVLLAHNNDLSGEEASLLVKVFPDDTIDALIKAYKPEKELEILVLQTNVGFAEGDAVAINEHGVAIAGGLSMKRDRNERIKQRDPLIENGLGGGARFIALQYASTARECVQLIGWLYNKYGIAYPSGVGVADTSELWYLETGGGKSWAAMRIPDSCYFVAANSYRIQKISFEDTLNFITSPDLMSFCLKHNLWDTGEEFSFAKIFGGGVIEKEGNNYYNTRRLLRAINLLNPELSYSAEEEFFPVFLTPSKKTDLLGCFGILRDYYQDTPYDIYLDHNLDKPERSIAVWRCVHTNVISLDPGIKVDYGAVLWTGLSSPYTAVYIPVYFGISSIPEHYDAAPQTYDKNTAFWIYKAFGDQIKTNYPNHADSWLKKRQRLESIAVENQDFIIKKAEEIDNEGSNALDVYLNVLTADYARRALNLVKTEMELLAE